MKSLILLAVTMLCYQVKAGGMILDSEPAVRTNSVVCAENDIHDLKRIYQAATFNKIYYANLLKFNSNPEAECGQQYAREAAQGTLSDQRGDQIKAACEAKTLNAAGVEAVKLAVQAASYESETAFVSAYITNFSKSCESSANGIKALKQLLHL